MSTLIPQEFYQAQRIFQYDYVYVDALLLLVWLAFLVRRRQWAALVFGTAIAPLIYFIDAQVWWNTWAGPGYPASTFIREYWLNEVQVPHPTGGLFWQKFGADFMMTVSYALFTFPWMWIVFQNVRRNQFWSRNTLSYTTLWAGLWLATPMLSYLVSIDDTTVRTVRHMDSQMGGWLVNLVVGYAVLLVLYWRTPGVVAKVFCAGIIGALIMEVPLYLFGIRPSNLGFLLFEGVILLNQGAPLLFLVVDKGIPSVQRRFWRS